MSVSHPQNVVKRLRQYLLGRPEVLDAYLFGSFARGSEEQHSDLDVAIVHRLLSDGLDDFNEFAAHVNRFISQDPAGAA